MSERPILVTGAHRSGTTWVGRTLATAPGLAYLHEPFHAGRRWWVCSAPVDEWYTYVSDQNDQEFYPAVRAMLDFRYDYRRALRAVSGPRDVARMVREGARAAYRRHVTRPRPLVKDPFLLFSAPWFAERFAGEILIMVRHPAAFASSIVRREWAFPFEHWLRQRALLQEVLSPFAAEIETYARTEQPLLDQAILIWRATHHVIRRYRDAYPGWIICRHEDVARDPMGSFARLFEQLDLQWSSRVERLIRVCTSAGNPVDPQQAPPSDIRRDSAAVVKIWQRRLTPQQIRTVREASRDVACHFYDDSDWE